VDGHQTGVIKKTELVSYSHPRAGGIIALSLDEKDQLISGCLTDGTKEILLSSREGKAIHFVEDDVRDMGRTARGVKGITRGKNDFLVSMDILSPGTVGSSILSVTENGFGKRSSIEDYRLQSRGGKGIITVKTSARNGQLVGTQQITDQDEVMLITDRGKIIRLRCGEIRLSSRNTQGVKLIERESGERVMAVARLAEREEEGNGQEAEEAPKKRPPKQSPIHGRKRKELPSSARKLGTTLATSWRRRGGSFSGSSKKTSIGCWWKTENDFSSPGSAWPPPFTHSLKKPCRAGDGRLRSSFPRGP
jgi:hypothetical protein